LYLFFVVLLRLATKKTFFFIMRKFENIQTYESYFKSSTGIWKVCKKPKRKPDYVSYRRDFYEVSKDVAEKELLFNVPENVKAHYTHHFFYEDFNKYYYDLTAWRVYYTDKRLGISSRYWYGEDTKGKWIIRESDHWGSVGKCSWRITKHFCETKLKYAKIYLS
jgi:hypothetical protein